MTTPVYKGVTAKLLNGLIYGVRQLFVDGVEKPIRSRLNFVGVTAVDDAENDWVELSLSPVDLSEELPEPLGTPAAGTTGEAADAGHVHAHGDQGGGSEHDLATNATHGFMPSTMMAFLEDATAFPSALQLVRRDANGGASFGWIATGGFYADENGVSLGDGVAIDPDANGATWLVGTGSTPGNDPADGAFVWADGAGKLWTLNPSGNACDASLGNVECTTATATTSVTAPLFKSASGTARVQGVTGVEVAHGINLAGKYDIVGSPGYARFGVDAARTGFGFESPGFIYLRATGDDVYLDGPGTTIRPTAGTPNHVRVRTTAASADPASGSEVWQDNGQLRARGQRGVQHEITCQDSATGATSKRILGRMARATIATGTTTDLEIIPAADLTGNWVARIVVEWAAWDTVDATVAGGIRFATVKGAAGTITVPTSGANQLGGTTDDNTMAAAMSTGASMLVRTSGANLQMRFITLKTDDIRVWARVLSATIVEH